MFNKIKQLSQEWAGKGELLVAEHAHVCGTAMNPHAFLRESINEVGPWMMQVAAAVDLAYKPNNKESVSFII